MRKTLNINKNITNSGFTLIELLVSLSILFVIITMVYSSFNATRGIIERVEGNMENYHTAQRFFRRLRNELASLRWSVGKNSFVFSSGPDVSVEGDFEFNLDDSSDTDTDQDAITFTALVKTEGSDVKLIEYKPSDTDDDGLFSIIYTRTSTIGPSEFRSFFIAERVKSFNLRFCKSIECSDDMGDWLESWSTGNSNQYLPKLIEVNLILLDQNNNEQTFKDIIRLLI